MSDPTPRLALGFPGQGGEWTAGVARLQRNPNLPLVRALAKRLGTDRWNDLDPRDTRVAQPVTFVGGLVAGPATEAAGRIAAVLGHSMGEITAATWAGAIEPTDGLDLVLARGKLGHQIQLARPGAMAAVMRWDRSQVEWLRRQVLAVSPGILEIAVTNSPTQLVLSGDESLVTRAVDAANEAGAVARRLAIGGPFHSPLMVPTIEPYGRLVDRAVRRDPRLPVVSSVLGRALTTRDEVVEALVRGLVLPVDWPAAVDAAASAGAAGLIDAGPGDTLTRLGRFATALPLVEL